MGVTRDDVLKIAQLAKLKFEDQELDAFTEQFQRILTYIEKLNQLDTENVPPTSHVTPFSEQAEKAFREDVVRPSLPRKDVLAAAPDPSEGQFRVPKVI